MKDKSRLSLVLAGLLFMWAPVAPTDAQTQRANRADPQPGVPEIMTMEGKFVRAAYNNEGYVILGYQPANRSIGEEWMLLEIGLTVLDKVPDFKLTRDALSMETPDGKTLPLPSVTEHRAGNTARGAEPGEGPARLDQLLSAEGEPGRAASASSPIWTSARCRGTRSR